MNSILEVCCGSYHDAKQAALGGAKRIELNSALYLGGLTPSLGTLIKTREIDDLKIICMVRPRGGGFCYDKDDLDTIFLDAKLLLENGADGLAFGFLNEDKTVNKELTAKMVALIHSFNKEAVFHRAIDICENIEDSVEVIIDCGCDRILTSGSCDKAIYGRDTLKKLHDKFNKQIEFLVGSGIDKDNAHHLIEYTGIHQIHSSCKEWKEDPTSSQRSVSYSYAEENKYEAVSKEKVESLIKNIE